LSFPLRAEELEQAGAFSIKENAEKMVEQLKEEGREAVIKETVGRDNKILYKVFITGEKNKPAAKPKGKQKETPQKPKEPLQKPKEPPQKPKEPEKQAVPSKERAELRVIIVGGEKEAREIVEEIKAGKSFAVLAKEKSIDEATKDSYGYLGEVSIKALDEPLRNAASVLNEGQVSDVIKLDDNRYALLQAVDLRFYGEGEKAFGAGDFKTAEENLKKHVKLNPDALKSYLMLGKIYDTEERFNEAESVYKTAINYRPEQEDPYAYLGRLYLKQKRYQEAMDIFGDGLKHNPLSERLQEGLELTEILITEGSGIP
jgi:tetratricopeptide (TPR) repeat protein